MQLDFREKAGRCRRLATVATEQLIRDELKRLADEFEKAALLLDISAMFSGTALAGGQDWRP
jgi:hypothetical protein